jgi:proteic killer suppression protein
VDILFVTSKLEKLCMSRRSLEKALGADCGNRLARRLDDLRAAECLADLRHLPGRCHELVGDRKGQLAIDVKHPHRLIFQPAHEEIPRREDGGLDWAHITAIRVLEITDYHHG